MKKLILIALLIVSCSKDEIIDTCQTQVQMYEYTQTSTILIFEGTPQEYFEYDFVRDIKYEVFFTDCKGEKRKRVIKNIILTQ